MTLARRLGVPERTARSWLRRGRREVVSLDDGDDGGAGALALRLAEAESQVARLELRIRRLLAVIRLLATLVSVFGLRLDGQRLPEGHRKRTVMAAIARVAGTSTPTALRAASKGSASCSAAFPFRGGMPTWPSGASARPSSRVIEEGRRVEPR